MASKLTAYEAEVLELLRSGTTKREIAKRYGVDESSVRRFVKRLKKEGILVDGGARSIERPDEEFEYDLPSVEEILVERTKDLERTVRAQRREDIKEERWMQRLEDAMRTRRPHRFPAPKVKTKGVATSGHEMVLLFSDTHAYEIVNGTETLGMNEYSRAILLQRMARLQERVLSYVAHRPYPITKLHVWMLGDMLSGDIHEELAMTNELPHEEATVQFALDAAEWLNGFVPHFETIRVSGVPGNHPRRSKKPSNKMAHNNSDWVAYKIIELYHRGNKSFEFNFPKAGFAVETVASNWRCLLMHGDGVRSTMPGVPWGGVMRRVVTLQQQFHTANMPINYVALGHYHTANAVEGTGMKIFMNGSVKGLDEYSMKQFGSGRDPMQLLLTFHHKHGVTDISYLDLVDRAKV